MKHTSTKLGLLALGAVLLVGLLALVGCQSDHPDDKAAVYNTLGQHDLASVEVYQDRHKGEITLRGIVGSQDSKAQAVTLAQQAAPGYTIKNQIQVQAAGIQSMEQTAQKNAALDNSIENNFKQSLDSDNQLRKDHIQYSANNGTLYLKGSVKSDRDRRKADELAKKVPQVQHVVNDLAVRPT
jgi:osmotically-inducible protein OsmY